MPPHEQPEQSIWNRILANGPNEWFKVIAGYGFAGIVAWYLLVYALPDMQAKFHEELHNDRAADAAEREKSRIHGDNVGKDLAAAIRELTRTVEANQAQVRDNQWKLIELQKAAVEKMK